jgi:hypothetical protein
MESIDAIIRSSTKVAVAMLPPQASSNESQCSFPEMCIPRWVQTGAHFQADRLSRSTNGARICNINQHKYSYLGGPGL